MDCPSLTLCCTSTMAFSMTVLPAALPVMSMACRMGTPELTRVPEGAREARHGELLHDGADAHRHAQLGAVPQMPCRETCA